MGCMTWSPFSREGSEKKTLGYIQLDEKSKYPTQVENDDFYAPPAALKADVEVWFSSKEEETKTTLFFVEDEGSHHKKTEVRAENCNQFSLFNSPGTCTA